MFNKTLSNAIKINLVLLMTLNSMMVFGQGKLPVANVNVDNQQSLEKMQLKLNDDEKLTIKQSKPFEKIDGKLMESDTAKIQEMFNAQKKMDVEDLKTLWEATVEKNTVIKFALKKLAMPAEQRRVHSSLMAKSVSALISGVTILPGLFGADSITSSASMATGSLANRVLQSKTMPKEVPLTDTELIQLAKLVEDLQNKLIKNYYEYKSSIENLKTCRQNIILQNKNYSNSIKSGNQIAIIASSALYDKELIKELTLTQEIKLNRLSLERLTGAQAIDSLTLNKLTASDFYDKKSEITTSLNGEKTISVKETDNVQK